MHASPEALQDLIEALRRYQSKVDVAVIDINRTVSARIQYLNQLCDDARREVRNCRDDLYSCDDEEDSDFLQRRLDRAEERLERIERRIGEVADALHYFKRNRAGLQDSISNGIPKAVNYLESKHRELVEYLSVVLPGEHGSSVSPVESSSLNNAKESIADDPEKDNLTAFTLPTGFQWIRLEDIDPSDDLRPEETHSKVTKEEVVNGFRMLQQDILPELQLSPERSTDYFLQCDMEKGQSYTEGTLRVYEAFFGESHIALSRSLSNGLFGVTNGRHRIKVARELGWSSVPARII